MAFIIYKILPKSLYILQLLKNKKKKRRIFRRSKRLVVARTIIEPFKWICPNAF